MSRLGGSISVQVDGEVLNAMGEFTYNLGRPQRNTIFGSDQLPQGYSEEGQEPMIEGALTDRGDFDLKSFVTLDDVTVTLSLANGKIIVLREAWFAGTGNVGTMEGNIEVKFVGKDADEVRA